MALGGVITGIIGAILNVLITVFFGAVIWAVAQSGSWDAIMECSQVPEAQRQACIDQRSQETGEQGPVVVAVDVPSGLSADGGALEGPVLPAASTVTFGAAKTAQLTAPGDRLCGRVEVVPIGIEAGL